MRDRLIELLRRDNCCADFDCDKCMTTRLHCYPHSTADKILADGWMRPPCKVGTTVYCIVEGFNQVMEGRVRFYTVHKDCIIYEVAINGYYAQRYTDKNFGKTAFLTIEEAEKALKGGGE